MTYFAAGVYALEDEVEQLKQLSGGRKFDGATRQPEVRVCQKDGNTAKGRKDC